MRLCLTVDCITCGLHLSVFELGHTPQESSLAGKRRVALFGHAGTAWCLYLTVIVDV